MTEWLKESSRLAAMQNVTTEDGATYLDDAPETPAPLFAFRAFKTAIFGTPQPTQYEAKKIESKHPTQQPPKNIQAKAKPEPEPAQEAGQHEADPQIQPVQKGLPAQAVSHELSQPTRIDQLASPTKGILLTPGTGATRRKTVSFSARKDFEANRKVPVDAVWHDEKDPAKDDKGAGRTNEFGRHQSALTKTLIELSTKRLSPPLGSASSAKTVAQQHPIESTTSAEVQGSHDPFESIADQTIDLSQPRSRSGQHWKAEFEEYHRRSNREMKKIIQYGQNVKSYAAKKDFEATNLGEKLQKELAKVARMETKVSRLAKQLKVAHKQGPEGESEQARLVGELAQQTAMAVRYQRKAEQYRRAIERRSSPAEGQIELLGDDDIQGQGLFEVATLRAQLESLQETAVTAERRASKLESENKQLKRSLARVKEEMMSYDSRRQAREERLKKREERHKADKQHAEEQLAQLRTEHQKLQQESPRRGQATAESVPASSNPATNDEVKQINATQDARDNLPPPASIIPEYTRQPSLSPRKRRSQKTAVDIWTLSSPRDHAAQFSPSKEATSLAPSSVKHDIHRALQEIEHNILTPEQQSSQPSAAKFSQRSDQAENANPTGLAHPLPKQNPANALPPAPSSPIHHSFPRGTALSSAQRTMGRSASLLSHRVGSRTSTMGSARTSSLSAERAAAAKARLAERKKSGEKKKPQRVESMG